MFQINLIKEKSPLLNPRTEKSIGVDLRGPRSRVSPDKDHRSVGIAGKLAFVPNICVQVLCKVGITLHVPGMTLFADMG